MSELGISRSAGYILLEGKSNEEILKEWCVTPVVKKIKAYQRAWRSTLIGCKKSDLKTTPQLYTYKENKRRQGKPRKRICDTSDSSEPATYTGH